jgi:hypothetical protein
VSAPAMVVQLTVEELRELLRSEVSRALEEHKPEAAGPSSLLARSGLALALGISLATVDRLVVDGCPHVIVSRTKRFDLAKVQEWLATRTIEPVQAKPAKAAPVASLAGVRRLSRGASR